MKIEEAIERQKRLTEKWEARIAELEDVMEKYPFEKMGYEGADWRPLELERRRCQVEESKLIIAALEKQITKEPKMFHCSCGMAIDANWMYCPDCGQRLF
jgi:hypothetical protein